MPGVLDHGGTGVTLVTVYAGLGLVWAHFFYRDGDRWSLLWVAFFSVWAGVRLGGLL